MRLIRFGTIDLVEKDGQDDLPIRARSALVELPDGAFDQDGSRVVLKPVQVSRKFLVIQPDIDGQIESLLRLLGRGRLPLVAQLRDNQRERVIYAKLTDVKRSARADTYQWMQEIQVTWQIDFPFWQDADDVLFFDTGLFFDSGLFFDGHYDTFNVDRPTYPFGMHNPGTARGVQGAVILVPDAASSISDLRLSNLTNDMSFEYAGAVAAGERLEFDLLTRTVQLDYTDAYADFRVANARQSDWMALEVGNNSLKLESTITGTVKLYWQWSRLYL